LAFEPAAESLAGLDDAIPGSTLPLYGGAGRDSIRRPADPLDSVYVSDPRGAQWSDHGSTGKLRRRCRLRRRGGGNSLGPSHFTAGESGWARQILRAGL